MLLLANPLKIFSIATFQFIASQHKSTAKSGLHVLSCLDTRKNQRRSRLKSPTRWVPRRWNCHAILFATPAAWLIWYRLLGPPPRSTPDPLPGQAFMPLLSSSAPFPLRGKGRVRSFPTFNLDDPSKSPLRGETLALQ